MIEQKPIVNMYLFDVDETLEVSNGPVKLSQLRALKDCGHIVGLCGNWAVFVQTTPRWWCYVSLVNVGVDKEIFMNQLKVFALKGISHFVLVGNRAPLGNPEWSDETSALKAGFEFIEAKDFKEGL